MGGANGCVVGDVVWPATIRLWYVVVCISNPAVMWHHLLVDPGTTAEA